MKNKTKNYRLDLPLVISEFIFLENIILIFILSPFLLGVYDDTYLSVFYIFGIIYITTILLVRKIYFYSDYLIILYPTRLFFRKRKIMYSNIKKIKYVYGKSAYATPEIQIRLKTTVFFYFYISLSEKKRREVLRKLYDIGLNVEIKSNKWSDNRILKDVKQI